MNGARGRIFVFLAALAPIAAGMAAAEDRGARLIETPPLRLTGDGAKAPTPASPPAQSTEIATPPLRLIGDSASPPRAAPERAPPQPLTIETRPLKLIGVKP